MKKLMKMKKSYVLVIAAGLLVFTSCSPKHRYGCSGSRCRRISLSHNEPQKKPVKAPEKQSAIANS